jgi:TolA-binding protein
MKRIAIIFLVILFSEFYLLSCAVAPPKEEPSEISVEEQDRLSMEKFEELLESTANIPHDKTRPMAREGFYEIIDKYPDSYLAEESYFRLIISYLEDFYPPEEAKAEAIYREYFEKYPKPRLNNAINDTMVRFYYKTGSWEKLVAFSIPYLSDYVKTGTLKAPLFLFFYSEGKFNLNDLKEARIGYKTLIHYFPNSREAKIAKEKLKIIQSKGF